MRRHTVVAIKEKPRDITKVSEYDERDKIFSNVNAPLLSVKAKYTTKMSGAIINIKDHIK
jgi:hypothetical protein